MCNIRTTLVVLAVAAGTQWPAYCAEPLPGDANSVTAVLESLNRATSRLQSYQSKVEYLFSQPVLESKTLRKGMLYYAKSAGRSKLRINFDTLKQDDEPQRNYGDYYIFDGQWLTHIDYQIKQVQKRQLTESNQPMDAFELAKRNFPLIGFDRAEDLKKEFDVNVVDDSNGLTRLHLTVKSDSKYKDDYKSVEVWIDKVMMLPAKILAVSAEDDTYEIKFVEPKANTAIDEKVFEFTIPDGFDKLEIIPLKK